MCVKKLAREQLKGVDVKGQRAEWWWKRGRGNWNRMKVDVGGWDRGGNHGKG